MTSYNDTICDACDPGGAGVPVRTAHSESNWTRNHPPATELVRLVCARARLPAGHVGLTASTTAHTHRSGPRAAAAGARSGEEVLCVTS